MTRQAMMTNLARSRGLLGEINDLKRIHTPAQPLGIAGAGFHRSWTDLIGGADPDDLARRELAASVVAARLGAIDSQILRSAGLDDRQIQAILERAVEAVSSDLQVEQRREIETGVQLLLRRQEDPAEQTSLPEAIRLLGLQPRAGATCPGQPRLILEPAETHAGHCYVTAVSAVLLAPLYDANPGEPFLAALAHHLHNAYLPDSGFTGEELLGEHLGLVVNRFTERALSQLPEPLVERIRQAQSILTHANTPEAKAFHAADVMDRVLQMVQYERVARFRIEQALEDLELVHAGPLQTFQVYVLQEAGLWTTT